MSPRKKAAELIEKFRPHSSISVTPAAGNWIDHAKACAVICVDEILELNVCWFDESLVSTENNIEASATLEYWERLKEEIINF